MSLPDAPSSRVYSIDGMVYTGEEAAARCCDERIAAVSPGGRDREIAALMNNGTPAGQVAEIYGLSQSRVRSIRKEVEKRLRFTPMSLPVCC